MEKSFPDSTVLAERYGVQTPANINVFWFSIKVQKGSGAHLAYYLIGNGFDPRSEVGQAYT